MIEENGQSRLDVGDELECSDCGARGVTGSRVDDCLYDLERQSLETTGLRPRSCVNRIDPATAPIPY